MDTKVSRRALIKSSAAAVAVSLARSTPAMSRPRQPNLLLVIADDMRWDAFGAAPNPDVHTPVIDKLALQGTTFRNNFVTSSICPTSRASILTGLYASRHNVWGFSRPIDQVVLDRSLPKLLRLAGYQVGFVGKWGIGGAPPDIFDYWNGFSETDFYFLKDVNGEPFHLTEYLAQAAIEFLSRIDRDRPFLLIVSFKAPHVVNRPDESFQPSALSAAAYAGQPVRPPSTATDRAYALLPSILKNSLGRTRWKRRFGTPARARESIRRYYALVTGLDSALGKILKALAAGGADKDTAVIFTSDNGFSLGDRGLAGKWHMYEESIRTPMIVRLPDWREGETRQNVEAMTLNVDIAPTLIDLSGADMPDEVDGRSLLPLLADPRQAWRKDWYYEFLADIPGIPKTIGVRTNEWKYMRFVNGGPSREALFNLLEDPEELDDRVGRNDSAAILASLRERTDNYRRYYG